LIWHRGRSHDALEIVLHLAEVVSSQQLVNDIHIGVCQLKQRGYLVEVPNIHEYISPYAEQVLDNCPEDLVDDIVAQYTQEAGGRDSAPVRGVPYEPTALYRVCRAKFELVEVLWQVVCDRGGVVMDC
jgi:hypothetical protein